MSKESGDIMNNMATLRRVVELVTSCENLKLDLQGEKTSH